MVALCSRLSLAASAVISWKCVANNVRQRLLSCRCSMVAQAMERPSKVEVPRPISSRITSAPSPAWLRIAARQSVGGADAGEQPVDHADMGGARRYEAAHLGEHRDQRVLAQKCRFARHVGAGHEPNAPGC